jgi:hypothetical protein
MTFPVGRSGIHFNAVMIRTKSQVRAERYIAGDPAKALFGLLHALRRTFSRISAISSSGKNFHHDGIAVSPVILNGVTPQMCPTGRTSRVAGEATK